MRFPPLIATRHSGVMALTPEPHAQIAAVYDKCAADRMVPPAQRAAFARKAEMFRMLARLGAKPKSGPDTPHAPKSFRPCQRDARRSRNTQRRGTYLRGSSVGSLAIFAATRRASSMVSTFAVSARPASRAHRHKRELAAPSFTT